MPSSSSAQTAAPSDTITSSQSTSGVASPDPAAPQTATVPIQPGSSAAVVEPSKEKDKSSKSKPIISAKPVIEKKSWNFPPLIIIALVIAALLIIGLILFFIIRNLRKGPNRVIARAASPKPLRRSEKKEKTKNADHSKDLATYAAVQNQQRISPYASRSSKSGNAGTAIDPSGPLLLNLFVEDQNTAIGKRNIHALKPGYSLTVGGGNSDFLIFLVPIPSNIGEIKRDSVSCTFIPRKSKYFPDLGSNELRDCINKTIRVISDRNYEIRFRFEQYEDPLRELNRLFNSLRVPG
jgi:hypothetical protein